MSNQRSQQVLCAGTFALLALGTTACGKSKEITLSNAAYSVTAASGRSLLSAPGDGSNQATANTAVSAFKLCISRIRLIGEDGKAVKSSDDEAATSSEDTSTTPEEGEIRFAPGLIDIGEGTAVDWGKVEIPVNFKITEMRVKVHKNKTLCGVDYSMLFQKEGGTELTTSQDVEFKFKFNPVVEVTSSTEKLEVSLSELVDSLATADLNSLKSRSEEVEGACTAK